MRILIIFILMLGSMAADSQTFASNPNYFVNEREKETITKASSSDYIELLLAPDATVRTSEATEFRDKIEKYAAAVRERNDGNYSNKELKKIYKEIHSAFLTKYMEDASFIGMHKTGEYNCVTATALFALILDKLNISYVIREMPTHVYLVAAPDTHHIVFETTTPSAKFVEFDQKVKQQYAQYLVDNKQITREEYNSSRVSDLFDKYFYDDVRIDKIQLVGLLYYNLGVSALQEEDFLSAYKNFEKAELLHPGKKHQYLVAYTLVNYLLLSDRLENEASLPYLIRFAATGNETYKKELVAGFLKSMADKLLFRSAGLNNYRQIYHSLSTGIQDSSIRKELTHVHHLSMAHYYDIKQQPDSIFYYLDHLYLENPNDLLLQETITSVILQKLRTTVDPAPALKFFDQILPKYSFIASNNQVMSFYMYCLTRKCGEAYEKNNKAVGDYTLRVMNELMQKNEYLQKNSESLVMAAIEQAYFYYVRFKQYKEAKTFLLSMQKLYPQGHLVAEKIKAIDNILRYNK